MPEKSCKILSSPSHVIHRRYFKKEHNKFIFSVLDNVAIIQLISVNKIWILQPKLDLKAQANKTNINFLFLCLFFYEKLELDEEPNITKKVPYKQKTLGFEITTSRFEVQRSAMEPKG